MGRGLKGDLVVNEPIDIEPPKPLQDGERPLHLDAEECGNLLSVLWHIVDDAVAIKSTAKAMLKDEDVQMGDKFYGQFRAAQSMAGRIERYADFLFSQIYVARKRTAVAPVPKMGDITRDLCWLVAAHMEGLDIDRQIATHARVRAALGGSEPSPPLKAD